MVPARTRRPPQASRPEFQRPVFARARRLCLELPETSETSSHGHPIFQAGNKTFCAFEIHRNRPSIAVRIPVAEFDAEVAAGRMFDTPYGRGAWTSIWVDRGHANEGATATPWNTVGAPGTDTRDGDGDVNWTDLATLIRRARDGVANKRTRTRS